MSVGDAISALRLLLSSRDLVRNLRLELSNNDDILTFFFVAQYHLRYFRGLRDLELVVREGLFEEDWALLPGRNVLPGERSTRARTGTDRILRTVDWLPISTKVTLVSTNLGEGIIWRRKDERERSRDGSGGAESDFGIRCYSLVYFLVMQVVKQYFK